MAVADPGSEPGKHVIRDQPAELWFAAEVPDRYAGGCWLREQCEAGVPSPVPAENRMDGFGVEARQRARFGLDIAGRPLRMRGVEPPPCLLDRVAVAFDRILCQRHQIIDLELRRVEEDQLAWSDARDR